MSFIRTLLCQPWGFPNGSLTKPIRQLEKALKIYISTTLRIRVQGDSWDGLCEKINHAEDRYRNRKEGLWHSIWYKMGDYSSVLDGWVALIPDAYGLAVVKTGLAVVFKVSLTRSMYILSTLVQGLGLTFASLPNTQQRNATKSSTRSRNCEMPSCERIQHEQAFKLTRKSRPARTVSIRLLWIPSRI